MTISYAWADDGEGSARNISTSISNTSCRNQKRQFPALQTHCTHPHTKCRHAPEDQRQNLIPASATNSRVQKHNALLRAPFPQEGGKKKKSSGFNSRHLCQIHLHPDGSVGELNDKVQSLSQEQPPPDTLGAPIPPLFGDNPISSRLCPQPTPAASLDLQGLELFWIRREDKWEPQLGKGNGGRVRSGHSQRMLLLEPQELRFATFISSCNKIGGLFWPVLFSECYFLLFCTKQLSALISTTLVFLLPSLVSHWFFSLDWTGVLEGVMSLIAWSNYHLPKTSQKEKEKKKRPFQLVKHAATQEKSWKGGGEEIC